jgi:uncharacterized protein
MEPLVYEQKEHSGSLHLPEMRTSIKTALQALDGLTLLRHVFLEPAGQAVLDLLRVLVVPDPDPLVVATSYSHAFYTLAACANDDATVHLNDAWQAYLVSRLIDDRNPWSEQVERVGRARVSPALRAQGQRDLRTLQQLFRFDAQTLWRLVDTVVAPVLPALRESWIPWRELAPFPQQAVSEQARETLASHLSASADWGILVETLEHYWSRHGTGSLARYRALRWAGTEKQLLGIAYPDGIRLENLVGHERQQARLTANIERFLAGFPAQDMLLYGPPGTGKSSTIKALANTYAPQGLCLVEVSKEDIADLSLVVTHLRNRAPRYLLFIDDLSFEEHETAYKALKVMLEGTAEARPANVLICVTSNRMNLIRENFNERGKPTEDVNWRDTMDEKQSLAHRFALRVTFISPDQKQYLHIVTELARQRGFELRPELLQERALQWERLHTGRSGRLARQFIDDLAAELQ